MRILIVSPTLNHGGAERVATIWAEGFQKRGHNIYFVSNVEEEIAYNLSVTVLPLTPRNGNKLVRYIKSIFLLRSYFKNYLPDVVIGVMYACSFLAKIASLGLKIPVVNTEHSSFEWSNNAPFSKMDWFAKFYLNYLYNGTTVLTKADLRLIGKRFKHVFVLPNPTFLVPLDNVPEKKRLFFAAGRLDSWCVKGFDVLIKAWGLLIHNAQCTIHNEGWRLQIAGTGSEESLQYLKSLCKENGVEDSVDFLGFVSDMESLYKKASVFVLSSRYEGFGMVLIEAMSQGCACIACDYMGRQREIMETLPAPPFLGRMSELQNAKRDPFIETNNGILCQSDNVDALAAAMAKMIEDNEYRKLAQQNAIERSKVYTIDSVMEKWEEILKNIVKN